MSWQTKKLDPVWMVCIVWKWGSNANSSVLASVLPLVRPWWTKKGTARSGAANKYHALESPR